MQSVRTTVSALVIMLTSFGCSSGPPQSTRITAGDHQFTVGQTIQKLVESDWFRARSATSPRATVTIDKVVNLTSDIIPESEQWMFVLSVWNSEPVKQLSRAKNVITQVTPERLEMIRRQFPEAGSTFEPATHQLAAVFNTATRAGGLDSRSEHYQLEYTMTELATGTVVWSGIVEFKRVASGNVID